MAKRIQQACSFLRTNDGTAAFLAVIERNRMLLAAIRDKLPPPLDAHCLHASLEGGTLTLVTDSPVWGSRLRFFSPELMQISVAKQGSIEKCRVRVNPPHTPRPNDGQRELINRLSGQTVKLLLDTADGLGETELAGALRRLAKAGAADD